MRLRARKALALPAFHAAALLGLTGCMSLPMDVHLAPLYTHVSTAGGGTEVEALFGALRWRRPAPRAPVNDWAARPLMGATTAPDGDYLARFIVPFGSHLETDLQLRDQLVPLWRYQERYDDDGNVSDWRFFALLPPMMWAKDAQGHFSRAIFPLGGIFESYLTFERLSFLLWPLYVKSEREWMTSYSVLWPLFKYGSGPRGKTFRFGPLFGRSYLRDFYDRRFILWPFFHYHENRLWASPEEREVLWMFWPLFGRARQASFRATTVVWPFFGWSRDPKSGFWALDMPWPLVRFLRPGTTGGPLRSRVWPFYSHYRGDNLDSRWYLWPLFNFREEHSRLGRRESEYFLPFYQHWTYHHRSGGQSSFRKLWPLYQEKTTPTGSRFAFPALIPLWDLPVVDEYYAWLYEIITREEDGSRVKERSWGGLWRREADEHEDRASLSGVWGRRAYTRAGEPVVETSFLFGLLRFRSGGSNPGLLRPAFPGPGWPSQREGAGGEPEAQP